MRVLIVEDEQKIANNLKKGLEIESFAVDVAYDGLQGYELAATEPYDCIVLDRMLPGLDGLTITKKLRQENISIPILMLTARSQLHEKIEGLDFGADDYLTKPFAFEELLARIRALIRRPPEVLETILQVGDLQLNPQKLTVTRNNQVLQLSAKEFSLLEFLMRHKNTIVTKDQIISHVWNYEADVLPNTVEVYIGYLRNKVDKPFAKPLIHTIRGFGYTIKE
jgi:DNA-binding response OmpR family regulator